MSDIDRLVVGQLVSSKSQQRDAIHIAVIPLTAAPGQVLHPGDKVTLSPDGLAVEADGAGVGVVDPYLPKAVRGGQRFLLFLYPGTIRTLRHEWTSDVFPLPPTVEIQDGADEDGSPLLLPVGRKITIEEKMSSEKWIEEFCLKHSGDVPGTERYVRFRAELLSIPDIESGDVWVSVHGESSADELRADHTELFRHIENVTGKAIRGLKSGDVYFSCWC